MKLRKPSFTVYEVKLMASRALLFPARMLYHVGTGVHYVGDGIYWLANKIATPGAALKHSATTLKKGSVEL